MHALVGNLPQNVEPSDALDKALGELEEAMLVRGRLHCWPAVPEAGAGLSSSWQQNSSPCA